MDTSNSTFSAWSGDQYRHVVSDETVYGSIVFMEVEEIKLIRNLITVLLEKGDKKSAQVLINLYERLRQ